MPHLPASSLRLAGCLVLLCSLAACSPSLSPLYRDYTIGTENKASGDASEAEESTEMPPAAGPRIRNALRLAGWEPAASSPPNAVATEMRTLRNWGLYRVVVKLEVVPLGTKHVRVYFHPYRRYLFGGRGKIPFLTRSLQRSLLPDLNEALEDEGLYVIGTPVQRDRATVNG